MYATTKSLAAGFFWLVFCVPFCGEPCWGQRVLPRQQIKTTGAQARTDNLRWLGSESMGVSGGIFTNGPNASFKVGLALALRQPIALGLSMSVPAVGEQDPGYLSIDVDGRPVVLNYHLPVTPKAKTFRFFLPPRFFNPAQELHAIKFRFTNVPDARIASVSVAGITNPPAPFGEPATQLISPLPSQVPLVEYERTLYNWLNDHTYTELGWAHDKKVRDTGPFVNQVYFGTHPAVKIYYSPEVMTWLTNGRRGEIADGAVIVKAMFYPPAEIYEVIHEFGFFRKNPAQYDELLKQLTSGWSVFIKDRGGNSADGWFYSGPGGFGRSYKDRAAWLEANLDNTEFNHPYYSGFGIGTCVRCHASAERENTFASLRNIAGYQLDQPPLAFRSDSSWRSKDYLNHSANFPVYSIVEDFLKPKDPQNYEELLRQLDIAPTLRPWRMTSVPKLADRLKQLLAADVEAAEAPDLALALAHDPGVLKLLEEMGSDNAEIAKLVQEHKALRKFITEHTPPVITQAPSPPPPANKSFLGTYRSFATAGGKQVTYPPVQADSVVAFPSQYADHVYPGQGGPGSSTTSPDQYITSNNCMGCHGGLGGSTGPTGSGYQVNMFVKTGPSYGAGYDISEFGEWRWSPMGLAGRDPIFHSQLETELIILLKNANQLKYPGWKPDTKDPLTGSVAENQRALINTCLSCHGAMGQRQLHIDAQAGRTLPSGHALNANFNPNYYYLIPPISKAVANEPATANTPNPPFTYPDKKEDFPDYHKYGELAREGIACAVCHHITGPGTTPEGKVAMQKFLARAKKNDWLPENNKIWSDSFIYFLGENTTGQYERSPADVLNGPFGDREIVQVPMQHALGITPKYNEFTGDSNMCGTCHTINLPNIGETDNKYPVLTALENNPVLKPYQHSIEQATYLEWLNSSFGPGEMALTAKENKNFKSCQDCHMPNTFTTLDGSIKIDSVVTQIASIQDSTYPQAENAAPPRDIEVPRRENYKRHELVGLNAFLVEMAKQFPGILGAETTDYETGATTGPQQAIDAMLLSAQEGRIVTVAPLQPTIVRNMLQTEVSLTNQTGHRFPSGAAFRRAFIEFSVLDKNGKTLWISGATNSVGVLTNGQDGPPLDTEFLGHRSGTNTLADYQPHYQVITQQDQVQIYEELIADANDEFTTSFIHRVTHVKDNRLLPQGWVPSWQFAQAANKMGQDPKQGQLLLEFMESTDPEGPSVIGGAPLFGDKIVLPNNGYAGEERYAPDPNYVDTNIGSDTLLYRIPLADIKGTPASVQATVYSQSFMPFWFHQRFKLAAEAKAAGLTTPETDRLYYIASHLDLKGTKLENWKLPLMTSTGEIKK